MSFLMSWDGYEFIDCAINPAKIFAPDHVRQSRPLYVFLGSIVGYSLYYLTYFSHPYLETHLSPTLTGQFSGRDKSKSLKIAIFLLGFVLINIIVLLVSFQLFEIIVVALSGEWKNGKLLFYALLFFLAGCQLTKIFFWTAHTQMFTLLTPLLSLYISIKIVRLEVNFKKLILIAFGSGLLFLLYGNFVMLWPVIVLCLIYADKKTKVPVWKRIKKYFFVSALFLIPSLIWITILKIAGVDFYSAEISKYREFVWITDTVKISLPYFLKALLANTVSFFLTFGNLLFVVGLFLIQLMIGAIMEKRKPFIFQFYNREQLFIIFVSGGIALLLIWLLGYYSDRLTFALAPIFLSGFAVLANRQKFSPWLKCIYVFYILLAYSYTCFFDSPHFSIDYYH